MAKTANGKTTKATTAAKKPKAKKKAKQTTMADEMVKLFENPHGYAWDKLKKL